MNWYIYAILDTVANELVGASGALAIFRNAAQAVRMFDDIMGNPQNKFSQRVEEYDLIQIGQLHTTEHPRFTALLDGQYEVVLTGKAWLATKQGEPKLVKES